MCSVIIVQTEAKRCLFRTIHVCDVITMTIFSYDLPFSLHQLSSSHLLIASVVADLAVLLKQKVKSLCCSWLSGSKCIEVRHGKGVYF